MLADDADIYWPMGRLTEDGQSVFALRGTNVNGDPLHADLDSDSGEFPVIVEGIVPNASDGAVLFDASEGQSLSIADSPFTNDTPDNVGVTNRTYELWFQPRNLPEAGADNRQILYEEGGTTRGLAIYLDGTQGNDPTEADLYVMTTNLAEEVWGGTTGPLTTDPEFAVSTRVEKDKTYHLVFVIDKPDAIREELNGDLIGYLNGQEFGRVSNRAGLWFDHTDDAGIGRPYADTVFHDGIVPGAYGSGLYFYDGIIDEFAIYDGTSLTAEQVQNHYLTGLGLVESLIAAFEADAARVGSGQPVTLSWDVKDVDALTISGGVGDVSGNTVEGAGSTIVNPTESTTYTLTATSGEISQSKSVFVFVGAPVINRFAVSGPATIRAGDSAILDWSTDGAASVAIEPGQADAGVTGTVAVTPGETTTYTLTATNEFGSSRAEVTVTLVTGLLPDLGWSASDLQEGDVDSWEPTVNTTGNNGIRWTGGTAGAVESGTSNFVNITKWVNTPGLNLAANPNDSWQDGLGDSVTKLNVSWEMVFRPGDFEGTHTLFNTGGNGDGTAFVLTDSVLDFRFQDADNDDQRVIASTDLAELGAATDFFHVVGLADVESDDTGTASIYVNGELRGDPVTSSGSINDWDGGDLAELGKGNNIPGGNPFNPDEFTGDIALFNYYGGILLAPEQVEEAFRAQSGASAAFQITRIAYNAETQSVEVTWNSKPGRTYAVDATTDFSTPWAELADGFPASPDGSETSYSDAFSENNPMPSALYYRIREERN